MLEALNPKVLYVTKAKELFKEFIICSIILFKFVFIFKVIYITVYNIKFTILWLGFQPSSSFLRAG